MNAASHFGPFDLTAAAAPALLLKVTLVLGAAWLVAALLRRRSAAARHDVWTAALLGSVALVLLGPLAPAIELPWAAPAVADRAAAATFASNAGRALEPARSQASEASPFAATSRAQANVQRLEQNASPAASSIVARLRSTARTVAVGSWAVALWAAGLASVLLWCLSGHLGLRRLARTATPLADGDWRALLAETASLTGVRRPVELRASEAVATPLTWGARRPIVVLPTSAASWPAERRRAALLHELAHVARHDYLAQLLATAACALYWFHPAAWMAARRLRQESERACDDRVLASGTPAAEYAAQLLEVARNAGALRSAGVAVAIGMARPSTLEGRLLAVLDESVPRRTLPPRARLAAGVAAALALVPFAGLTPVVRGETMTTRAAASTVSNRTPPTVSVHSTGSGGAGVSFRAPVAAGDEGGGDSWNHEAQGGEPAKSVDQSVAASPGEELFLDLETGAGVAITGWDEPRVQVRGQLGGSDWRDSRVDVKRGDRGVTLRVSSVRHFGSQSTSHRFQIRVPRRYDVRLESAGGDFAVDSVEGRFEGSTGGGDVTLTHLRGSAHVSTGGGTVRVADCHLDGSVTTGGGPITLSRVSGGLRGSSGSGPVVYREAPESEGDEGETRDLGDVEVDHDGDVDLGGIDGDVPAGTGRLHITRAGGDVRLAGAPDGAEIHTGGGTVVVGRSAGFVDASTGGGDVKIGPVAGSVRAGTGAGRVEVTLADARGEEQSVEIHSGNGAVVLVLPAGFDGTIDLETAYTKNHDVTRIIAPWELQRSTTDWDDSHGTPRRFVRAKGTAGSGRGGHVKVRTVNGNVEVRLGR